jgi:nitrogen fixation/metabolism regulation signal transduction histidine kinase
MRGRLVAPYFTTKSDGTGLGLAIVKKIVVEHGGEIDANTSTRLGGARFVLHLPE